MKDTIYKVLCNGKSKIFKDVHRAQSYAYIQSKKHYDSALVCCEGSTNEWFVMFTYKKGVRFGGFVR